MEVCIFGVLTVNLLTFSSQNAPLPSEMLALPMPAKDGWLSLGRKKFKRPFFMFMYIHRHHCFLQIYGFADN